MISRVLDPSDTARDWLGGLPLLARYWVLECGETCTSHQNGTSQTWRIHDKRLEVWS